MYVCAAFAAFNLLSIALYFPSAPPLPPSISAAVYARANAAYNYASAKAHMLSCLRNRSFIVLALCYGTISGLYVPQTLPAVFLCNNLNMYGGWSALESANLASFNVQPDAAGYISGSSIAVAAAATVALGAIADRKKKHKTMLLLLLLAGLASILCWSLMLQGLLPVPLDDPARLSILSVMSVVVALGFYSSTPIFFEAAIEASHPLPQGGVIMLMTVVFNVFSIAMLAIPAQGVAFNWLLSAAAAVVIVVMMLTYEDQNHRTNLETPPACEGGPR
jgi:hypothetical protein